MLAAGAAALLAGCSDASRFSPDPFSDPFGSSAGRDEPLGAESSTVRARVRSPARRTTPPFSLGRSRRPPKNAPSSNAAPVANAGPAPRSAPAVAAASPGSYNHWSAEGGTPVTVGAGETATILANRYGVPTDVLLKVNGFSSSSQVQPGSRLVIPVYRATAAKARPEPEAHPAKEARVEAKPAPKHVAAKADAEEDDAPRRRQAKRARGRSRRSPQSSPSPTKRTRKRPRRASLLKRRPRPRTKRPRSPP